MTALCYVRLMSMFTNYLSTYVPVAIIATVNFDFAIHVLCFNNGHCFVFVR